MADAWSVFDELPLPDSVRQHRNGQSVIDATIAHLQPLPRLSDLDLQACSVTDDALQILKSMQQLRQLDLRHVSTISAAAVASLRGLLPNCHVEADS